MTRTAAERIYDELLVLRSQDGDADSFALLSRRWHPRLIRHAWHLTGRSDFAADAVQEAWLAMVRGIKGLKDPARFPVWAYSIVTRKCADQIRRLKARPTVGTDVERLADPAPARGVRAGGRLRAALMRLSPHGRAILALRYLEGMPVRGIAEVLGVPEGTVKSRLHAAREELREWL